MTVAQFRLLSIALVSIALIALLAVGCGKTESRPAAKPSVSPAKPSLSSVQTARPAPPAVTAAKPAPAQVAAAPVRPQTPAPPHSRTPAPAVASTPAPALPPTPTPAPAPAPAIAPAPASAPTPAPASPPAALHNQPVRVVNWNVKEMFRPVQAEYRTTGFTRFAEEMKPDVLLIEEVVSSDVLAKLRDVMKLDAKHLACSNFVTNSEDHAAFEVGIISKFPLDEVIEYDTVLDGKSSDHQPGDPEERLLVPPTLSGLAPLDPAEPPRGFLWARIDALKLCVCVVHLKSSRGGAGADDLKNAEKRELVAATIAARVNEERKARPDYTCLVAGDLNVGCHDKKKNGHDLMIDDHSDDMSLDRYDETHALLADGLVGGLKMKNLALGIQEGTFIVDFPGTGPIDNIYVVGPAAERFAPAQKAERAYSSDHYPVWTVLSPN